MNYLKLEFFNGFCYIKIYLQSRVLVFACSRTNRAKINVVAQPELEFLIFKLFDCLNIYGIFCKMSLISGFRGRGVFVDISFRGKAPKLCAQPESIPSGTFVWYSYFRCAKKTRIQKIFQILL